MYRILMVASCLLFLSPSLLNADGANAPTIELYTMGPGPKLVEKFGHSAICVRYATSQEPDTCYNYGTTNFNDFAGLAWGFVRGRAKFWVSKQTPQAMLAPYIRADRDIWVQKLRFSPSQAQSIAAQLRVGALEENRYYQYHHYYDNCATRVRDIIDTNASGRLSQKGESQIDTSYRDLTRSGFADLSPLTIASDYILGRIGDTHPSEYESMFLPRLLRQGVKERMGIAPIVVHQRVGSSFGTTPGHERIWVMLFSVCLALPLWWLWWKRGPLFWGLFPPVLGLWAVGIVTWGLALVCPLPMARFNENLLLFFPIDVVLLFLSANHQRWYARCRLGVVLLGVAAAFVGILKQPLWAVSILPIATFLPIVWLRK